MAIFENALIAVTGYFACYNQSLVYVRSGMFLFVFSCGLQGIVHGEVSLCFDSYFRRSLHAVVVTS